MGDYAPRLSVLLRKLKKIKLALSVLMALAEIDMGKFFDCAEVQLEAVAE